MWSSRRLWGLSGLLNLSELQSLICKMGIRTVSWHLHITGLQAMLDLLLWFLWGKAVVLVHGSQTQQHLVQGPLVKHLHFSQFSKMWNTTVRETSWKLKAFPSSKSLLPLLCVLRRNWGPERGCALCQVTQELPLTQGSAPFPVLFLFLMRSPDPPAPYYQ